MTRSSIRVRTGVMEIGLKLAGAFGDATFYSAEPLDATGGALGFRRTPVDVPY